MGFSEINSTKCRKHPNQRNLPGVCSSCLREKLSKLSVTPEYNRISGGNWVSGSSSFSPPPYSSTSSAESAAVGGGKHHRRSGSEAYVSVLHDGLNKSRSVSYATLCKNTGGYYGNLSVVKNGDNNIKLVEENNGNGKKKSGFLKRLVLYGKKGGLLHSRTMKERSCTSSITSNRYN